MVRNKVDGTEYALKFVRLRDTDAARNNLLREVNHLARLLHPNVVRYYSSWFEYDSGHWKYVEKPDEGDELGFDESDSEYDYEEEGEDQTNDPRGTFDDIPESENGDGDSIVQFVADSKDNRYTDRTQESSYDWKKSVKREKYENK